MTEASSTANIKNQTPNENSSVASDGNDLTVPNVSYDSNESTFEEESNEKWASPWKVQHKGVEISTYYSPDNFYVTQKSELYVFDRVILCQIVR